MLTSVAQVNTEFFKRFHGLTIQSERRGEIVLPCIYAKKSSEDYTEADENQRYPCIAIQDLAVRLKDGWFKDFKRYAVNPIPGADTAALYSRPLWMEFPYDVSIATKSYNEFMAMQALFMQKFEFLESFIFDGAVLEDGTEVGDVVPFTLTETDIPRTDGVFEKNYSFVLSAWLYLRDAQEFEAVKKIVIDVKQNPNF